MLDRLRPGAVICIASSVAPQTCRDLATLAGARGIGVLDTPVVLGQKAADTGELTIYVGGEALYLARASPALSAFGRKIIHVGAVGSGQIAKTMNNLLLWACMCANFEVLTLAKSLGADVPKLVEALNQGQRRQLVAVALGFRNRQMGREGYGRGARHCPACQGPDAAIRTGGPVGEIDQSGQDESAAGVSCVSGMANRT